MNKIICSSKKHSDIPAINYCIECKKYLCNKCQNFHSDIFENHHSYNLDIDIKELFTGLCDKYNHANTLQYYCKTHNELCCAACLCKIKGQGNGQHKDCIVMPLNDIKEEKKKNLKENVKLLENMLNTLDKSINQLKNLFTKINENKEELKLKMQKLFTKIRNAINDREDELLLEIDKKFEEYYFNESIIKDAEKLPNKIKLSLEKGKKMDNDWKEEELNKKIFDCINIENNIKDINIINEKIKKCDLNENNNIYISNGISKEGDINIILENIKNFGSLSRYISLNSKIIKNEEDKKMILNWINPNKNLSFKLLYQVSRDGDKISTFAEKVSGKYPTLVLVQTKSGFKFGGYTSVEWNMTGNYNYKKDESAFIFSIDKKKKYKLKDSSSAICGDPKHFAFGGGHDISIYDKCTTIKSKDYSSNHSYEMKEKYELTGGESSYYVQDLEVYQIVVN